MTDWISSVPDSDSCAVWCLPVCAISCFVCSLCQQPTTVWCCKTTVNKKAHQRHQKIAIAATDLLIKWHGKLLMCDTRLWSAGIFLLRHNVQVDSLQYVLLWNDKTRYINYYEKITKHTSVVPPLFPEEVLSESSQTPLNFSLVSWQPFGKIKKVPFISH